MDIRRDEIRPLFVAQELHKIPQWAKAEHLERYISLKELWEYPEREVGIHPFPTTQMMIYAVIYWRET